MGGGGDLNGVIYTHHESGDVAGRGGLAKAHKPGYIREHFVYRNWKAKIAILQEVPTPLPGCDNCGMHMLEDKQ